MNDPFPAELPPVRYFLMMINNEGWFNFFRILAGAILLITVLLYICYRKNLIKSKKHNDKS